MFFRSIKITFRTINSKRIFQIINKKASERDDTQFNRSVICDLWKPGLRIIQINFKLGYWMIRLKRTIR